MIKTEEVVTFEKAMEAVSESIANLKRFTESLNKFLEANGLGSAEYSADYPAITFQSGEHGYDIAMFHLRNRDGEDVAYFYVYTAGTVYGEDMSDRAKMEPLTSGCTYIRAMRYVLELVGVMHHSALSREKIDKAIEALQA